MKTHDFRLNGVFSKRKRVIFAKMGDFREENTRFSLKWQISEEKTRDFHLNGGFAKRKRVICGLNGGLLKRKRVIFGLNGRFAKRKRVIFAKMGDSRRENA